MRINLEGAGKGDSLRPVNQKLYAENYERIFGKKNQENTNASDSNQNAAAPCIHTGQACCGGDCPCNSTSASGAGDAQTVDRQTRAWAEVTKELHSPKE